MLSIFTPAACGMGHNRRTLPEVGSARPALFGCANSGGRDGGFGVAMVGTDGD